MGLGLYDAAFAALGRLYGTAARGPITGITLLAGFASTVGWPLTALGADTIGWRETCFAWALAHLLIGLPLNRFLLPRPPAMPIVAAGAKATPRPHIAIDRAMLLLAFAFASAWMVTAAMAAHLPRLLQAAGASPVEAVAAGALIGPAQVAARALEASVLRGFHPLISARFATIAHPIGAVVLALLGGAKAAAAFALLYGAGNGILTIARGTVPLAVFGPENYGYRLGLIGAPARMAQAAAPLLFGFVIDRLGAGAIAVSSALSLAALAALCLVHATNRTGADDAAPARKPGAAQG
jgi:predicted MFS family arabinose efflux permease